MRRRVSARPGASGAGETGDDAARCPEALLELGELNLRMSDFAAADQVLRRMEGAFSEVSRHTVDEHSIPAGYARPTAMGVIAALADLGKGAEVRQELRRLFPAALRKARSPSNTIGCSRSLPAGRTKRFAACARLRPNIRGIHVIRTHWQTCTSDDRSSSGQRSAARPKSTARPTVTAPSVNLEAIAAAKDWEAQSCSHRSSELQLASLQLQARHRFAPATSRR